MIVNQKLNGNHNKTKLQKTKNEKKKLLTGRKRAKLIIES